jgi:hypothetical protein
VNDRSRKQWTVSIAVISLLFLVGICIAGVSTDSVAPPKALQTIVSTDRITLNPQEIMSTWKAGEDDSPVGYFTCWESNPTPDGKGGLVHVHRDIFFNPVKDAFPAEVIMFFNEDTKQVYSIIWMEGDNLDVQVTFIWCTNRWVKHTPGGPACPPGVKL